MRKLTRDEILKKLRDERGHLKKFGVKKIGLFGSYTMGCPKRGSDIDILIEFDEGSFDSNFTGYFDNYIELQSDLKKKLGKKIDLLTAEMISPYIRPYILKEVIYV